MNINKANFPKRILMTADPIGGVWTYSIDLCRKLGEYKIKVALAVMGKKLSEQQIDEAASLPNVQLYQSSFKLEWMENPWNDIDKASQWLLNIKEKFRPDIIHLNHYSFGSINWNVPCIIVAHSDLYSRYNSVRNERPSGNLSEYYNRVSKGILGADYLVAPTDYMLKSINNNFYVHKEQKVIYNARDKRYFIKKAKNNYIMGIGTIRDEAKNLMSLVNVSPKVDWPVYIAGENQPDNGNSFEMSNINFWGSLSSREIADTLARASIYVLPANYAPFGLTVLEAALSGCALVLGDIPSLKEIWGDNAIYVKPDDEKSLTDAINFLIKDEDFRRDIAAKAQKHSKNFSVNKMCLEYISLYTALISDQNIKRKVRNEY